MRYQDSLRTAGVAALLSMGVGVAAQAQTILTTNNGIIRNSLCVGVDCQLGIPFVDSTIIVKENNTRIKFADTSVAASFPRNDWELEANSQTNGGANRFSIFDCGEGSNDGGCSSPTNVFSVEAGAGNNALYVDDGGRVGFGTGTPVVELHVVDGDTPTLRLEQNTSAGFAAQTWDVAGNETNFFIRDATFGSRLPFRIQPNAPTNSIFVAASSGNVGLGTNAPDANAALEIRRSGNVQMFLTNSADNTNWRIAHRGGDGRFSLVHSTLGTALLIDDANGDMTVTGDLITGGSGNCAPPNPACDAVFDSAIYDVPSIEEHAALMWENKYLPAVGPTGPGQQVNVANKMLRMLNELEHAHIYIEELNERIKLLEDKLAEKG